MNIQISCDNDIQEISIKFGSNGKGNTPPVTLVDGEKNKGASVKFNRSYKNEDVVYADPATVPGNEPLDIPDTEDREIKVDKDFSKHEF